jgi:hypothetical protein
LRRGFDQRFLRQLAVALCHLVEQLRIGQWLAKAPLLVVAQ